MNRIAFAFALILATPLCAQEAALTVEVAAPETLSWSETLTTNGRLEAWQEAVIAAEISGQTIVDVKVDVGATVKKGDVLATLSRETIENAITQQEAAVLSAEAALDQARADADRVRELTATGSGAISKQETTQYLVAERKAEADLASAKAALSSSQLDLARTEIHAPDDGVIASRSAALGAVTASGTELFRLIRQNRIEWQAEVPLRQLARVAVGTKVEIPTPANGTVPGEVRLISPTASETTGRVLVYVSVTPPEGAPTPKVGMMISGRFVFGQSDALTVPATAITLRDGLSYVFVLDGADKVTRKRVETGRRQDDRVEITTGITATDQVVQAGGAFLTEGATVTVAKGN